MGKYKLEDAQAMSILNKKTFDIPSNEDLLSIQPGNFVKVNASGERFWVKVEFTDSREGIIYGRVDNDLDLTHIHGLKYGDDIEVRYYNVYSIHK